MNPKCVQQSKCARNKPKRSYRQYRGLVKLAAQIAGTSASGVYAVLSGRIKSANISRALKQAEQQLRREAAKLDGRGRPSGVKKAA